ncbi:MAG: hypothetical protein U1F87_11090 [Kiritimatiellia bacterium]
MKKIRKKFAGYALALLALVSIYLVVRHPLTRKSTAETWAASEEIASKQYYADLQPVRVSGRVMDDQGGPLEGARVELVARTAHYILGKPSPAQKLIQNSALDGSYQFVVEKPSSIFLMSITREGYELDRYANNDMRLDWAHTPSRPLVHKMRKIGEPTFLLQRPSSTVGDVLLWPKAPDSKSERWSLTNLDGYYDFKSETRDLEGRASYDVQKGEWEITYRAVSVDGGVIMSTQRLFRAPEDGYQREVSFRTGGVGTNTYSRNSQYYLYLKTRKPLLYARVDVEQSIGLNREFPCRFAHYDQILTNPTASGTSSR